MSPRLFLCFSLAIAALTCTAAHAVPVVIYDLSGNATGINDLTVNASVYNVSFVGGAYNSVFAIDPPTFFGDEPTAQTASDAIMNVLNNEPSTPHISAGPSEVLWVPFALPGNFLATQRGHTALANPWQPFTNFSGNPNFDHTSLHWYFAVFEPASTAAMPEPATATLGLLALTTLATRRRRTV